MINWGSLGLVAVVSLAAAVAVVVLVSFALVGFSARERAASGINGAGVGTLNATTGTAVAVVCLLAVVAIVAYGLYLIIA